jgi:hypothetical protein
MSSSQEEIPKQESALVENKPPDTEVREGKKRRILTTEWKLALVRRFDQCENQTERGKLLRSESIFLSQVYAWKRDIRDGKLFPGCQRKRGPVPDICHDGERLEKENERLKKKLLQAEKIIELQKKVAALFGENDEST